MPPKKFFKSKKSFMTETYTRPKEHKWLIIVESPSKCTKIEHLLGTEYKCIASKGHLRTISGLKSINAKKNYEISFSVIDAKKSHIETMRKIIEQFPQSNILLGSDDDREGEAIAWHICDIFGLNVEKTPRILFHEITKYALEEAVKNPTYINMNLVHAQWARQVLDVLIGYKISPLLWKYMYNNKENSLSAGRCQTPALRLVYDNEKERLSGDGFQKKYKVIGRFSSQNLDFTLNKEFENQEITKDFLKKSINFQHHMRICSPKDSTQSAPKPFNTSNLLQTCNNVLKLSPTETMSLCQELYQSGFITYMRTDNKKYSKQFLNIARGYISENYGDKFIGILDSLENKDNSNPHEAIRVTNINMRELEGIVGKKATLYRLIWKNTVQSCMANSLVELTDVLIDAPDKLEYKYVVEIPKFLGWKKCAGSPKDTEISDDQNRGTGVLLFLRAFLEGKKPVQFQKIDATCIFHNKHSHYTESSLIKKLEDYGIGRPSTFAMFIETIQERGYVKKQDIEGEPIECLEFVLREQKIEEKRRTILVGNEKNKLVIQPIGIQVIEFLTEHFNHLFSYSYTKELEENLDNISEKGQAWQLICEECSNHIKVASKPVTTIFKESYPLKGGNFILKFTMNGPLICSATATENENMNWTKIRKDVKLNIDCLKRGEYSMKDLEDLNEKTRLLGKWENEDIYIKHGKFGYYLEWGSHTKAIAPEQAGLITIEDVPNLLETIPKGNKNILRVLDETLSIRKGRFGPYVYYKTWDMQKPDFFPLKKCELPYSTCEKEVLMEWIKKTHLDK